MVSIKIESPTYNCVLELNNRLTYLRGDSATGKTYLVDCIMNYLNGGDDIIKLYCSRHVTVMSSLPSIGTFSALSGMVVFYDDRFRLETANPEGDIIKELVKNDAYLVVIDRVGSKTIDFNLTGILNGKKNGFDHWFLPNYLEGSGVLSSGVVVYDCTINLDSNESVFVKVDDAVMAGYKEIQVLADFQSFGNVYYDFKQYCNSLKGVNIYLENSGSGSV